MSKIEEFVKEHGGLRVIKRILIANNGMAATKAILSMRQFAFTEFGVTFLFETNAMAKGTLLEKIVRWHGRGGRGWG